MKRGSRLNHWLDFYLGIPVVAAVSLLLRCGRRRALPNEIRRIGMMCSPALGDTLLFSAVLQDVRSFYPEAEIVHICMPQNLAAAELIPGADRRVVVRITDPIRTISAVRKERFDIFLDFSSWQRLTAFYSLTSGARYAAGFRTAGQYRGAAYSVTAEHRADRHEVDNFRSLLGAVGIPAGLPPRVQLPVKIRGHLDLAVDMVIFHPWAGTHAKEREWPVERWLELAAELGGPGTEFVITGGPADKLKSQHLVESLEHKGFRAKGFSGVDGFISLADTLRRARVVVSVNTGVMHFAAILGCPTVSINGPTNNQRWGPVGPRVAGVAPPGTGCGYLNLGFEFDGRPADCMSRTPAALVAAAARQVENLSLAASAPISGFQ